MTTRCRALPAQTNATRGFQKWACKRRDERKRDRARYAELGALAIPGELQPTCLVCGGRGGTGDGHDSCRGRW
jgi:hypothetical protein